MNQINPGNLLKYNDFNIFCFVISNDYTSRISSFKQGTTAYFMLRLDITTPSLVCYILSDYNKKVIA